MKKMKQVQRTKGVVQVLGSSPSMQKDRGFIPWLYLRPDVTSHTCIPSAQEVEKASWAAVAHTFDPSPWDSKTGRSR